MYSINNEQLRTGPGEVLSILGGTILTVTAVFLTIADLSLRGITVLLRNGFRLLFLVLATFVLVAFFLCGYLITLGMYLAGVSSINPNFP